MITFVAVESVPSHSAGTKTICIFARLAVYRTNPRTVLAVISKLAR